MRGSPVNFTEPQIEQIEALFQTRLIQWGDCWEWPRARMSNGYGVVQLYKKKWLVHRLSYTLWVKPIPEGLVVMHLCDNRACLRPGHLAVGTLADNNRDMWEKGRGWREGRKG